MSRYNFEINLAGIQIFPFIHIAYLLVGKVYTECKMYISKGLINAAIIRHSSV
jgi:hypothetical protein